MLVSYIEEHKTYWIASEFIAFVFFCKKQKIKKILNVKNDVVNLSFVLLLYTHIQISIVVFKTKDYILYVKKEQRQAVGYTLVRSWHGFFKDRNEYFSDYLYISQVCKHNHLFACQQAAVIQQMIIIKTTMIIMIMTIK